MLMKHYNIIGKNIEKKNIFCGNFSIIVNEEILVIQEIVF